MFPARPRCMETAEQSLFTGNCPVHLDQAVSSNQLLNNHLYSAAAEGRRFYFEAAGAGRAMRQGLKSAIRARAARSGAFLTSLLTSKIMVGASSGV